MDPLIDAILEETAPRLQNLPEDCCRLLHGRGHTDDRFRPIAVDWFAPVLLITCYGGMEDERLADLARRLHEQAGPGVGCILLQNRGTTDAPVRLLAGSLPEVCEAKEDGMHFLLNFTRNRNHGFFPDMIHGRRWIRQEADGCRILNLFAYTCSLSVAALAGGAAEVVNIDMSRGSIATGQRNHVRNRHLWAEGGRARFLSHNLFRSWGRLQRQGPFDLVVIDPPTMQGRSFHLERDYPLVVRRLAGLTRPGSRVLAAVNSPFLPVGYLESLFAEESPGFRPVQRMAAGAGFEERKAPGQAGLRMVVFQREG